MLPSNECEESQFPQPLDNIDEENIDNLDALIFIGENAFTYVCGYLYKKSLSLHKCLTPIPRFDECDYFNKYTFSQEKEFAKNNLIRPPDEFILYIEELNKEFNKHFDRCCHMVGLSKYLYEYLKLVPQYKCCENMNNEDFLNVFIRTKIYFTLKFFNRDAAIPNLRNKFLKVSHI